MADTGESLVSLDRNHFNDGILSKYKLIGTPGNMFDWNQLYNIPILSSDIKLLVETIGFLFDRCRYKIKDRHLHRNNKDFICQNCNTFKLIFAKSDNTFNNNQDYSYLASFLGTLQHSNNCNLSPSNPIRSITKYLLQSPLLINLVKRQLIEFPNENRQDHDLIISGLCLNGLAVSKRQINRVLATLKKKLKIGTKNTI
jgi:hypothetical protein